MNELVSSTIPVVITAVVSWFLSRRKTNAEATLAQMDAADKAAKFYQNILDDAKSRLEKALETIDKQDERIRLLLDEVERLTEELRKYKQLNGKQP